MEIYTGRVKNLKSLGVTDPTFAKHNGCNYFCDNFMPYPYDVKLIAKRISQSQNIKGKNVTRSNNIFVLALGIPKVMPETITFEGCPLQKFLQAKEYQLGCDSQSFVVGANDFTNQMFDNNFPTTGSFSTLMSGIYGSVFEFTYEDVVPLIMFSGALSCDAGYTIEDIANTISNNLGVSLTKTL